MLNNKNHDEARTKDCIVEQKYYNEVMKLLEQARPLSENEKENIQLLDRDLETVLEYCIAHEYIPATVGTQIIDLYYHEIYPLGPEYSSLFDLPLKFFYDW